MPFVRTRPSRVKPVEIGDVERIEDTLLFGREGQLLLGGLPDQAGIQSCDCFDTSGSKSRHQIAVHRVLVEVDLERIHGGRSAPVLLLKGLCFLRFGFQVGIDFRLVGVVTGQGRMNLS
jgi:hypothetical protein